MKLVLFFAVLCLCAPAVSGHKKFCHSNRDCQPTDVCYKHACLNYEDFLYGSESREKRQLICTGRDDDCLPGFCCVMSLCIPCGGEREKRQLTCTRPADCYPGYCCMGDLCIPCARRKRCASTDDCLPGMNCDEGDCIPLTKSEKHRTTCTSTDDCRPGSSCVAGACFP